jgi:PilZ domain
MPTTSKKSTSGVPKRVRKYAKERAVKRCQLVALAEIFAVGTGTKLQARTSEIGIGGCYVDALCPFAVGTALAVRIVRDDSSFHTKARVVYSDPSFGMGLAFESMDPEQRNILEDWVAEIVLAGRTG